MKDLNYYLSLNYEMIIKKENDYFVAYFRDFPRILGAGDNEAEAIADLKEAFICFIQSSLKNGDKIKEPSYPTKNYAITMKTNIMEEIDKAALNLGISRSALITIGMQSYISSL
ncbi:MAG: type II toxin-antitoxin system HicB family antitoxin [Helicobacter sp.]|nr:type II toxin-antitoxin system HicB family antitoxin [Helicobacter sp.]